MYKQKNHDNASKADNIGSKSIMEPSYSFREHTCVNLIFNYFTVEPNKKEKKKIAVKS